LYREQGHWHNAQWGGKADRVWIFTPDMARWVQVNVLKYYGIHLEPLSDGAFKAEVFTKDIEVLYLGKARMRDDGEWTATGLDYRTEQWAYTFPLNVLRVFFNAVPRRGPIAGVTHFQVLGIPEQADELEIRRAWKRLIRQWHPDVCKEPDAAAMSQALNAAKDILLDPKGRRLYLANMAAVKAMGVQAPRQRRHEELVVDRYGDYRPPLRCGRLRVTGHYELARLVIDKIISWDDITRGSKVLVTSWNSNLGEDGQGGIQQKWVTV
jgi:hypothetical protein